MLEFIDFRKIGVIAGIFLVQTTIVFAASGTGRSTSRTKIEIETPVSASEYRSVHKVGVGAQAAGALGLGGAALELNFTSRSSFMLGWGGGSGFQAVSAEWRHYFQGENILPFLSGGLAHWENFDPRGPISRTTPSFLADRLMNDDERSKGIINKNLIFPSIGVEYLNTVGPWKGSSVFLQILVLVDVKEIEMAPTAALGSLYYF